jgi:hypothetical protein
MTDTRFDRLRTALAELRRLIEEQRRGEEELSADAARLEKAAVEHGEVARNTLAGEQERDLARLDGAHRGEQETLSRDHAAADKKGRQEFDESCRSLESAEEEERTRIGGELREALWMSDSVSEGGQKRAQEQLEAVRYQTAVGEERIAVLWKEAAPLLARFDLDRKDVEPPGKLPKAEVTSPSDPQVTLGRAEALLQEMRRLHVVPWSGWVATVVVGAGACVLAIAPAALVHINLLWLVFWALGGVMAGFLAALTSRIALYSAARRRLQALGRKLLVELAQARDQGALLLAQAEPWAATQRAALQSKCDADRRQAQSIHRPRLDELTQRYRARRQALEDQYKTNSRSRREQDRQELEDSQKRHEEARARLLARHEKERRDGAAAHAQQLQQLQQAHRHKELQLRGRWQSEAGRLLGEFTELQTARSGVTGLSVGTLTLDARQLAGELPAEKLAPFPAAPLHLPAYLPFPRLGGLLLHAHDAGRTAAVQTLQALMLRLLTSLPPGKVRFTIFDPVGLGDNFAAFMHLADHDEALVSGRIWTEPAHIEKQLADLTVHMENVIQRYLRSQFRGIEEYNAQAGEVAEPYRVLVMANFPVNFTPQAARRLVSIVQSGSSCGVYTLIGLDTNQPLPQDFRVEDLEQLCLNLYWREDRFHYGDAELDRHALRLDAPPAADRIIETARRVGALSRDANRVQVPFSFIAPPEEEIWKGDSRRGVRVPLGRLGAVKRLALELGKGTSQHVLVAGKTGSGKSTLWHALIVNLALLYRPDEIELYLIDFKKGVEFKHYATHRLPHARVIAVESEREFGLSVLQRLDSELRQRGDRFRAAGVNDIAGYRDALPDEHCPRILLIVDEFQEFFVEDDRLSQEAALLLDRLVRQGRAFGLHVLLGSQTLGGAYSLARSTIDQMAVRVALQCSEADAQLILNKDNGAARLLSRPGEAIYNDANGAVEGNEIFQVVWLPEEEREQILGKIRRRAERELPEAAAVPPLVFEGNTPAELEGNPLLRRALEPAASEAPARALVGRAWLGEAIAIKDPTAAVFRRQTGDNLLIVGQNDEAALALLTSAVIGLAAQQPSAQFVVVDGTAEQQPHAGYLREALAGLPNTTALVERPELASALAALTTEMNARLQGGSSDHGSRYLLINGLHMFREFRRSDDDLGFGRRGAERTISPLEHLQSLLRDGPVVGIHILIWCDSLVNLMRSLDRAGLRECGQRVLFQMSGADSSHLLDSPLAGRLGRNRALFSTEEQPQPEKFRPYGLPSLAWLADVKRLLADRERTHSPS